MNCKILFALVVVTVVAQVFGAPDKDILGDFSITKEVSDGVTPSKAVFFGPRAPIIVCWECQDGNPNVCGGRYCCNDGYPQCCRTGINCKCCAV